MTIFNGYVSLPEGTVDGPAKSYITKRMVEKVETQTKSWDKPLVGAGFRNHPPYFYWKYREDIGIII